MWIFKPILKSTIWGGRLIKQLKYTDITSNMSIGESWEISAIENNVSIVAEGPDKGLSLTDLINKYGTLLLGSKNFEQFGNKFPLLIKFIDADNDLSVQVHPNDIIARQCHNSLGKTEMWYVVNANTNANIYCGFKDDINIEKFKNATNENTILNTLQKYTSKQEDVFFIPAGRIHAIGAGNLILEIQQSSDITYRIYDYDRTDANGQKRTLHTDLAINAINFNDNTPALITYDKNKYNSQTKIISSEYFTTEIIKINKLIEIDYSQIDSFISISVVEGICTIESLENKLFNQSQKIELSTATTILLPATTKKIKIHPTLNCTILATYIE